VRGGCVVGLGDAGALRRRAAGPVRRIDCGGATVMPGLVDPHLHLFAVAARSAHLDCGGFDAVPALLAAIRRRAGTGPPDAWVRGEALDEDVLGRLPTVAELDRVAPGVPVRLRHRSRHASVLNTAGLARLGERPGVECRRGEPTGLVYGEEAAVGRAVGRLPAAVIAGGLLSAAAALREAGVTTVADATPRTWRELAPLRGLIDGGRLGIRVFAMRRAGTPRWRGRDRLRPGPVKLMVEEGPGGLRPGPAALARRIALAAATGAVAVHCLGAPTLVAALSGFAALPGRLRRRGPHRLEHVAECPPPLVREIAALGLTVVTNPAFVRERGDAYRRETEATRWSWLYRARTLAAAGVPLAAGSDAPIGPLSPWIGLAAARTRRTIGGAVLERGERLGASEALALFTRGAADALGAPTLGRLHVGGPADLIVVEPDPLRAPPDEVAAARVVLSMLGGEITWRP
jgi:predicted amidohydrolase YtcJ